MAGILSRPQCVNSFEAKWHMCAWRQAITNLNQHQLIVTWNLRNKLQWNTILIEIKNISSQKMHLKMSAKCGHFHNFVSASMCYSGLPCGWKVRLQCIAVRKECALQTHLRILQRTPTHSYALPHFLLLKGTHSKRTPWTSFTNQNSCTPNALLKLRVF